MWFSNNATKIQLRSIQNDLDYIILLLNNVLTYERKHMADLTSIRAAIVANNDAANSVIVLLKSLSELVRNTAPDQAALDQLATEINAKAAEMAAAVVENTPSN